MSGRRTGRMEATGVMAGTLIGAEEQLEKKVADHS